MPSATPFKLSVSTLACPAWTLEQIIENVSAVGIGGIDFRGIGKDLDITQLPAFGAELLTTLSALADRSLRMPCLNSSVVLVTPSIPGWELMIAEAERYARLGKKTDTLFLRIFGGAIPITMTHEDALELATTHLRQIVEICRPRGIKPLLETHDSWVVSQSIFELVERFSLDQVGVLWDLEHPFRAGESPAATADALKKWIAHVHIKDTVRQRGASIPVLLGEGELPLRECLDQLRLIGYSGWITLETEKRWHAEGPEPEVSLQQFVRYMSEYFLLVGGTPTPLKSL